MYVCVCVCLEGRGEREREEWDGGEREERRGSVEECTAMRLPPPPPPPWACPVGTAGETLVPQPTPSQGDRPLSKPLKELLPFKASGPAAALYSNAAPSQSLGGNGLDFSSTALPTPMDTVPLADNGAIFPGGPLGVGGLDCAKQWSYAEYHDRIAAIYSVHNPDKVQKVDSLLEKYKGQEEYLYQSVCTKYNVMIGTCEMSKPALTATRDPGGALPVDVGVAGTAVVAIEPDTLRTPMAVVTAPWKRQRLMTKATSVSATLAIANAADQTQSRRSVIPLVKESTAYANATANALQRWLQSNKSTIVPLQISAVHEEAEKEDEYDPFQDQNEYSHIKQDAYGGLAETDAQTLTGFNALARAVAEETEEESNTMDSEVSDSDEAEQVQSGTGTDTIPTALVTAPTTETVTTSTTNTAMIDPTLSVFRALDLTGNGYITSHAMRRFAILNGFEGNLIEWTADYESLCEEWQCSPQQGISEAVFRQMVNNTSEKGCACSNKELQNILDDLSLGLPRIPPLAPLNATALTVGDTQ